MTTNKLYSINDSPYHFRAGHFASDGLQALLSRQGDNIVCLKFSADGKFLGWDSHLLSVCHQDDDAVDETDWWMNELGITPRTICVQKFSVPELSIEIKDIPDYLYEYIDQPTSFPKQRQQYLAQRVDEWHCSGSYVLIWDEEYEMSKDGDVEST